LNRTIRHHFCESHLGSANRITCSPLPSILAVGSSNGDMPMLAFAESSGKPFLNLVLHHISPP